MSANDNKNSQTAVAEENNVNPGLELAFVRLLKKLAIEANTQFTPVYSFASSTGYVYPGAAEVLGTTGGSESIYLEQLADRNYLVRTFFDKVLLCPSCRNSNLNLRELCQECHQADVTPVTLIHHYSCSLVAPEAEFLSGISYVCPKCKKQLQHIGVDYDKPGQRYQCHSCKAISAEIDTGGQCRACSKDFAVEDCVKQVIYAYRLGPLAKEAIMTGHLNTQNQTVLSDLDPQTGVYRPAVFRKRFHEELERSRIYRRPMSILNVQMANNEKVYQAVMSVLRQTIAPLDVPTFLPEAGLICLLLECDRQRVDTIAQQIRAMEFVAGAGKAVTHVAAASFPQDDVPGGQWAKLLEALRL